MGDVTLYPSIFDAIVSNLQAFLSYFIFFRDAILYILKWMLGCVPVCAHVFAKIYNISWYSFEMTTFSGGVRDHHDSEYGIH